MIKESIIMKKKLIRLAKKGLIVLLTASMLCGNATATVYADDLDGDGIDDGMWMGGDWENERFDDVPWIDPVLPPDPIPEPTPEPLPSPEKLPTPSVYVNALTGYIDNVPDGACISYDNGASWSGPVYGGGCAVPDGIRAMLGPGSTISVKLFGDGIYTLDSDVQTIVLTQGDFPAPEPTPIPTPDPTPIPTPDPTPIPTPDPTPIPPPDPTPIPTPDPTPIPTPDPTPIPIDPVKLPTPNARFEASTMILGEVPSPGAVSLDGGFSWFEACGYFPLEHVDPNMEIMIVTKGDGVLTLDSDPQIIWISKADRPMGVSTMPTVKGGATGSIVNVSLDEQYRPSGTANWINVGGSSINGLAAGNYEVRVAPKGTQLASDPVTVTVDTIQQKKLPMPEARFDGYSMVLSNISVGMAISYDGSRTWEIIADSHCTFDTLTYDEANRAIAAGGIRVKRLGDGITTLDSDTQIVWLSKASTPTGLSTTSATNGNNGSIKGVASDMQYCKSGTGSWIDIGSNTVTGLAAGKYDVRRRASGSMIASDINTVTISSKKNPDPTQEPTPQATFNVANMTLSNVYGCRYSLNNKDYSGVVTNGDVVINEGDLNTAYGIHLFRPGNGSTTTDSQIQYIELKKANVPSTIGAISATTTTGGTILGVNDSMEYKAEGGYWTSVPLTATSINNLPAGTYYVRIKGYYTTLASDSIKVIIQKVSEPIVIDVNPTPVPDDKKPSENNAKKEDTKKKEDNKKQEEKKDDLSEILTEQEKQNELLEEEVEELKEELAENEIIEEPDEENMPSSAQPMLYGSPEITGWGAIEAQMDRDSVTVEMNGTTYLPAEVISGARSTNTEIILDMSEDIAWTIQASSITDTSRDVDMGIKENVKTIPDEVLKKAAGDGTVAKRFDVNHDGDFGFTATLKIKVDPTAAGKYANLMYYNKNKSDMELIDTCVIADNGDVSFDMTHASSYAVIVTPKALKEATTSGKTQNVKEAGKASTTWIWILCAVILICIIGIATVLYVNNQKKPRRR